MIEARPAGPGPLLRPQVLARLQRPGRPRRHGHHRAGHRLRADARLAHDVAELWIAEAGGARLPARPCRRARAAAPTPRRQRPRRRRPATFVFEIGVEELPAAEADRGRRRRARERSPKALGRHRPRHGGDHRASGAPPRRRHRRPTSRPREDDREDRRGPGPKVTAAFDADGNPTKAAAGLRPRAGRRPSTPSTASPRRAIEHVGVSPHGRRPRGRRGPRRGRPRRRHRAALREEHALERRPACPSAARSAGSSPCSATTSCPFPVPKLASGRETAPVPRPPPSRRSTLPSAETCRRHAGAEHRCSDPTAAPRQQIVDGGQALAAASAGTVDVERGAVARRRGRQPRRGAHPGARLVRRSATSTCPPRSSPRSCASTSATCRCADADGALLPHFVAVANGACDPDVVRAGQRGRARARYEDAAFFWPADRETPLAELRGRAGRAHLRRPARLGGRPGRPHPAIAAVLAGRADLGADEARDPGPGRARWPSSTWPRRWSIEMTSLAGTMAREYARRAGRARGRSPQALAEMELPRSAGDAVPGTLAGALLVARRPARPARRPVRRRRRAHRQLRPVRPAPRRPRPARDPARAPPPRRCPGGRGSGDRGGLPAGGGRARGRTRGGALHRAAARTGPPGVRPSRARGARRHAARRHARACRA